ncbi:MAG: ATP-dependent helicase HrpB, partial [Thermoanaerobaculia bacterium]
TRIPPLLAADGPTILLQPRRVAARSLTRRIAAERGWTVGREVGWQIRFERNFGPETRLLVATEGILTRRLESDPLLSDFTTVVLDEFHERSVHSDLALALAREAFRSRDDLRLVVMSATLDATRVAEYLGCDVVEVPGRVHPLEIEYAPRATVAGAVEALLKSDSGDVLVFLPGAREIRDAEQELRSGAGRDLDVLPLHGGLTPEEQDSALQQSARRKVILATNIAETSLTVEGVSAVVDGGLHRIVRFDESRGIDELVTERIPRDSAEQRAGRAARTGAGRVIRLWDERDFLEAHREPEILRVDLAPLLLDIIAWGGDPHAFPWFDPPRPEKIDAALELLERLDAIDGRRIAPIGQRMQKFPLHPRLARVLIEAGPSRRAAALCAVISEPVSWRGGDVATDSDVLTLVDHIESLPFGVRRAAEEIGRIASAVLRGSSSDESDAALRRALFLGFADRVARRRSPGTDRFLMANGSGAILSRDSGVKSAEWIVAVDVDGGARRSGPEALIRMASAVDPEWLAPTGTDTGHRLADDGRSVTATRRAWYGRILLSESPDRPVPEVASGLLVDAVLTRPADARSEQLLRRLRFAGVFLDLERTVSTALEGVTSLPRGFDLLQLISHRDRKKLDQLAPESLPVPSGRNVHLDYRDDGSVIAPVKLQELFGLAETPRIGPNQVPVVFSLLGPNGRPVQTTSDLRSFWERTYPEVRKELRGRYPRHPWPEDPWNATPTARTKKR